MDLADQLARNIRALRGDKTQEVFARKLGVSRPSVARFESGAQNITINILQQICRALRCDIGELFKE